MGMYRIMIEATGGHGCQREKKDGEKVLGCRRQDCPDCVVQEFLEKLHKINPVSKAELIHWPNAAEWGGTPIVDEYVMPTFQVKTYNKSKLDKETNQYIETNEVVHYVDSTPIHRIRHGNF